MKDKETEEATLALEREDNLKKIIESKKYNVDIKEKKPGSPRTCAISFLLILLSGVIALFLLIDTNIVNVGFDLPFRIENQLPAEISVPQMIRICDKYKVMMKAHNCDYLSNIALRSHPYLGIHAINVAPEFELKLVEDLSFLTFGARS